ncbi:MAG: hypothetical protein ACR2RL_10465 [Gammaproteobacteria bacterium]
MRCLFLWFTLLLMPAGAVHGVTIIIPSFPPPAVLIAVGSFGPTVDQVTFNVPVGSIGNGVPVVGTPSIQVLAAARAAPANSRVVGLVADSRVPLSNGTNTIPFSAIDWTASDSDIPSGTFNGNIQLLALFFNSRIVRSTHTFRYSNTQVLDAGTYTGRVTYTLIMP